MGLADEAANDPVRPGTTCSVRQMIDAVERNPKAEPLTRDEFEEALASGATARAIARALRKRYESLGIAIATDQSVARHRRRECQSCYGAR